jgi:hypothetical protein
MSRCGGCWRKSKSPRTIQFYDQRHDKVSLDEVERILI